MKKITFTSVLLMLTLLLCISAFAKTDTYELVSVDKITYTLEEDDKLSCELLIDEDGLYEAVITDLSTTGGFPATISVTIYDGKDEISYFETSRKSEFETDEEYNKKHRFILGLKEGEYKLVIENKTKFSDVTFTFESTFTEEENTESFGNFSFENATEMEFRTKYRGGVSMHDETDFYTFTMPYDGYAFLEMYTPSPKYFFLYDENKNEIGGIGLKISEADKVYSLRTGLPKGKYYIAISPDEDYLDPAYSIEVISYKGDGFEKEYNNEKDNATVLDFGNEYQGNMFGYDDIDVYSFTLYDSTSVTIDFSDTKTSGDGHYSISLSDDENEIYSVKECEKRTIVLSLEKGTYYIKIRNSDTKTFSAMAYKISVDVKNSSAATPPEADEPADENENISDAEKEEATESEPLPVVSQFDDVKEGKWYYGELLEAKNLGLIEGIGGNLYKPEDSVTVAEIITMAARIRNSMGGANTEITNSPVGKWYNSYITFAVNSNLIKRDDFDNFERNASRAEVAYIFANIFDDAEAEKNIAIPDVDENTKYGREIHKLYNLGILNGDADGAFRPNDGITRAEAAAILLRVHKAI